MTLITESRYKIHNELAMLAQIIAVALDMARLHDDDSVKLQLAEARQRIEAVMQALEKKA